MNFLHGDVKSENVLVGHHDTEVVYLIDFGLAEPYLDKQGRHNEHRRLTKFNGNFMFASNNMCDGISNSRRSDIESALYLLIYLLNQCKLPWSDFNKRFDAQTEFLKMLNERTKACYTRQLVAITPKSMRNCVKRVLGLGYEEEPPYDYILECL